MKINNYLVINGDVNNRDEAIKLCGEELKRAGYVEEGFITQCILREKEYPTGLPTDIPVAIPHCKSTSILEDSICLLKLNKPILFYRMDDSDEYIETDTIFNIAIKDSSGHLAFLQNLMKFVSDKNNINKLKNLSKSESINFLKENIG